MAYIFNPFTGTFDYYTTGGGGGGTPAGSTGQAQFNNAGAFGADSSFFWDNTNKRLGVDTSSPQRALHVNGNGLFGQNTGSYTATPVNVSFGGTYGSNTPGTYGNLKWDMYNDAALNRYGIGMSPGLMEYQAGDIGSHQFFVDAGSPVLMIGGGYSATKGYVGIGTSAPKAPLTVAGSMTIGNSAVTGVSGLLDITNDSGTYPKCYLSLRRVGAADWGITLGNEPISFFYIGLAASTTNWFWRANWNDSSVAANTFQVPSGATNVVSVAVKAVASQTANLQEWQNVSGTGLSSIEVNGTLKTVLLRVGSGSSYAGEVIRVGTVPFLSNAGELNSVFLGRASGSLSNTGAQNVGVGANSLASLTTGTGNSGVGFGALTAVTTGYNNTGVGILALQSVTTGSNNIGIGTLSLSSITTAIDCLAIAPYGLSNLTTGSYNISVGRSALNLLTTGTQNVACGTQALSQLTTHGTNAAFGHQAAATVLGDNNALFGGQAGQIMGTASYNSGFGSAALYQSSGDDNTALGFQAGLAITTGSQNTFLGAYAGASSPATVTNSVAIGRNSQVTTSHQVVLGTSAEYVLMPGSATIQTGAVGNIGLTIQGAASQSANLQQWQNNSTTALASMSAVGKFSLAAGLSTSFATAGGSLFQHFADAGNSTTTETDLYSDTTPASVLGSNGDKLVASYGGVFVSSGTATRQIKIYFGGTAIFDTGALTLSLSSAWTVYLNIVRVSSTVVRYMVSFATQGAALSAYTSAGELTGLTLSNTNILKITGQAGGVGAATNDIVAKLSEVSWYPAA